jgi:hypothetical protein
VLPALYSLLVRGNIDETPEALEHVPPLAGPAH